MCQKQETNDPQHKQTEQLHHSDPFIHTPGQKMSYKKNLVRIVKMMTIMTTESKQNGTETPANHRKKKFTVRMSEGNASFQSEVIM